MLPPRHRVLAVAIAIVAVAATIFVSGKFRPLSGPAESPTGATAGTVATLPQPAVATKDFTLPEILAPELSVPPAPLVEAAPTLDPFRLSSLTPPALTREFRAAWIATVGNIDWPSRPGLSTEAQQAELIRLLDHAAALRLNAILLQVRPASDALYASKLEPWSAYLTGTMGKAPAPFYDPLEFAVTEAHKRGLELHAWFNPFRALTTVRNAAKVSPDHVTKTQSTIVRKYGDLLWLDPGEPAARTYVLDVIADVVQRYDIDGVHLDDYFYPYPTKDRRGRPLAFPDEPSWKAYLGNGGTLARDDWRRENINTFVRELYARIKAEKTWVKLGISPFGIWRPQAKPLISGLDSFQALYADSRKWLQSGWLDYVAPQLYWSNDAPRHSYPVLLDWWADSNQKQRHLWPGIATGQISNSRPASDILAQISLTREKLTSAGNIHWHFKSLLENVGKISEQLSSTLYAEPALIPASSWLGESSEIAPEVSVDATRLSWSHKDKTPLSHWAVQTKRGNKWDLEILPRTETAKEFVASDLPEVLAISAIDRFGNASPAVVLERADL